MLPAPGYKYIEAILNEETFDVGRYCAHGIPVERSVVGFVFFDQNLSRDPVDDFLSNIDLLNEYSGNYIHFFLPGVSYFAANEGENGVLVGQVSGNPAFHNAAAFTSFKDEFEKRIPEWNYEYGVDVVLMDVIEVDGRRVLDFSSAIFFKVEEFIHLGIVERTSQLLQKIIKFQRDSKLICSKDARVLLGNEFGKNWFKGLVLGLFPNSIQELARAQAVLGGGSALR